MTEPSQYRRPVPAPRRADTNAGSDTGTDVELLAAIQQFARLMSSRQASSRIATAAGADVNQQGVQIVRALYREGEQPIAGLAAAAHMDISAVSRQLRLLEGAGLVRRAAAASDGRVALVSLTSAGKRMAKRIREVGLRHLSDALASWPDADRKELARLLGQLVDDFSSTEIVAPGSRRKRATHS